jgi:hypothetical protein
MCIIFVFLPEATGKFACVRTKNGTLFVTGFSFAGYKKAEMHSSTLFLFWSRQ